MSINVGDLIATSLRNISSGWADNITDDNAVLAYMKRNGNLREYAGGGRVIGDAVLYGDNASHQFFSGYDTFSPPVSSNAIDLAEYNWKQQGVFIAYSGLEEVQNMEENRRKDWIKAKLAQAKAVMENGFATSIYSDGTAHGGKEYGGLKLIVADDPTGAGTVGGIDQQANSFWRNYYSAAASTDATNIRSRMNLLWLGTKRGKEECDLYVCGDDMYNWYESSLQAQVRFTDTKDADAGFSGALRFKGGTVLHDGTCPSKKLYGLNTKYLSFRYAPGHWFEVGKPRQVTNADYKVVPMDVMGNFTTGRRAAHGVIIAS